MLIFTSIHPLVLLLLLQVLGPTSGVSADSAAPIIFQHSGVWDGNDGPWATFNFDLGSPYQRVRLLPSFALSYIAPVGFTGCPDLLPLANCSGKRGNLYNPLTSDTWAKNALRNESSPAAASVLDIPDGSDTITISGQVSAMPINHQAIRVLTGFSDYIGLFGLSANETSITSGTETWSSFVKSVLQASSITTIVWSYTAGNFNSHTPPSLVLGGYDATRFNNGSILHATMNPSPVTRFIVTYTGLELSDHGEKTAMQYRSNSMGGGSSDYRIAVETVKAVIDLSTPFMWLPDESCDKIESNLKIKLDPVTQLYIIPDDLHRYLLQREYTIKFSMRGFIDGTAEAAGTRSFELGYASLYLNASYPLVNGSETFRYFPLKRGLYPSTQMYTLGRAFLQDTHLTADFGRSLFALAPAKYVAGIPPSIIRTGVDLPPQSIGPHEPLDSSYRYGGSYPSSQTTVTPFMIIGLPTLLGTLLIILGYCWWAYKKRKWPFRGYRARKDEQKEKERRERDDRDSFQGKPELDGSSSSEKPVMEVYSKELFEADGRSSPAEVVGWEQAELHGNAVIHELDSRAIENGRNSRNSIGKAL